MLTIRNCFKTIPVQISRFNNIFVPDGDLQSYLIGIKPVFFHLKYAPML